MHRIEVSPEQLRTAILVWIKTAPKHIWRELEKQGLKSLKHDTDPLNRYDPREAMANYLAGKFVQAGWQISHEQPKPLGSPPPFRGK